MEPHSRNRGRRSLHNSLLGPPRYAGHYGVNPEKDRTVQVEGVKTLWNYSHDKDADGLQDERGSSRS